MTRSLSRTMTGISCASCWKSRSIAGIRARPIISKIYRWMKSMPRYTVGHIGRVAAIDETLQAYPGLYLAGSSYRGIGIGDCVKSGFDAAEEIDRLRRN